MKRILIATLLSLVTPSAWAANELIVDYPTGATIYAVVNDATGQSWNGSAFATYTTTRGDFDIAATEISGTGRYRASFPGSAGYRSWTWYLQAGGSPSHTDDAAIAIGSGYWDGSALVISGPVEIDGDSITTPPVEHTRVPGSRTLVVGTRRDSAETTISGNIRMRAGETLFWAANFGRTQLTEGDLVDSISAPTVTGTNAANCTVPTYGVYGTLVKFKVVISGAALTTDVIYVNLSVTPESGETYTVKIPVEVIE